MFQFKLWFGNTEIQRLLLTLCFLALKIAKLIELWPQKPKNLLSHEVCNMKFQRRDRIS